MAKLEDAIKQFAHELGFSQAGIARAAPADQFDRLTEWLERGYAGEMEYMRRRAEARKNPASILPEVRSVIMLGMEYGDKTDLSEEQKELGLPEKSAGQFARTVLSTQDSGLSTRYSASHSPAGDRTDSVVSARPKEAGNESQFFGKIARYAAGEDYHDVIRRQLNKLLSWLHAEMPGCHGRGVVDTAPLLERDFARRAGLGWIGKNTMLINKHRGSYFFLAALLVDLDLESDPPHDAHHCGTCTACLDACPTQAFIGPGWLDSRKCISYLTIELRSPIPDEFRGELDGWLFGCDVCQEVCPWNRRDGSLPEAVDLIELLNLDEEGFRLRFRRTALMRTKRRGLLRNAALLLGEQGDASAIPALQRALADPEPMIREAAAWALNRICVREGLTSFPA
jgi:epoxyqueuosine reductase